MTKEDVEMTETPPAAEGEEDGAPVVDTKMDDDVALAQMIFDYELTRGEKEKTRVVDAVEKRNMANAYTELAERFGWMADDAKVAKMREENQKRLAEIDAKIADAVENLGDVEIRDAMFERAKFYGAVGELDKCYAAYEETEGKTASVGQKMDGAFAMMRLRFSRLELNEVKKLIVKIKELLEQPGGGDWERKNRLKVYEGLHAAATRDFATATKLFLDSLSTFTSYELVSYDSFVFLTVVSAIVSLPRTELKAKVIDSPEVLSVLNRLPGLGNFLNSLHRCDYKTFMQAFPIVASEVEKSVWLNPHYRYFLREVRVVAYAQYLQSYKSVTVKSMADSFNVSEDFIDRELSHFIVDGRLNCKIDKVSGVLQTNRPDVKNALYQSIIKDGDRVLNSVSKLSRVIDL